MIIFGNYGFFINSFIIFLFLILYILINKYTRNSTNPSAIFSLLCFSYLLLSSIFTGLSLNPKALLFIFCCTLFFSISVFFVKWDQVYDLESKRTQYLKKNINTYVFFLSFISFASVLSSVFIYIKYDFSLIELLKNPFKLPGDFAKFRVLGEYHYGYFETFNLLITYSAAMIGGVIYSFLKRDSNKNLWIVVISLFPAIFYMLLQSSKICFLVSIISFLSASILLSVSNGKYNLTDIFNFKKFSFFILLSSILIIISFISRNHYFDPMVDIAVLPILKYDLLSYLIAPIYAFSDFFSYYINEQSIVNYISYDNNKSYAFSAFHDIITNKRTIHDVGIYSEVFFVKDLLSTNIFTVFRQLIMDFGIKGTLIFMFLLGLISNISFYNLIRSTSNKLISALMISFLFIVYNFIFLCFLQSPFNSRFLFFLGLLLFIFNSINFLKNLTKS